jgi:hypothetical protein
VGIFEGSFTKIKGMGKESIIGKMVSLTQVIGEMGKRKVLEFGNQAKEIVMWDNGRKER